MVRTREDNLYYLHPPVRVQQQVQFPTLDHFVDDVLQADIGVVRVDLFEELKPSELSFINYITLTLFVTASDRDGATLYEYSEPVGTRPTADAKLNDSVLQELAERRLYEVAERLKAAHLAVRHGRFTVSGERME